MENRPLTAKYDGYGACPLLTSYNTCIVAEFLYGGVPHETLPFNQVLILFLVHKLVYKHTVTHRKRIPRRIRNSNKVSLVTEYSNYLINRQNDNTYTGRFDGGNTYKGGFCILKPTSRKNEWDGGTYKGQFYTLNPTFNRSWCDRQWYVQRQVLHVETQFQ